MIDQREYKCEETWLMQCLQMSAVLKNEVYNVVQNLLTFSPSCLANRTVWKDRNISRKQQHDNYMTKKRSMSKIFQTKLMNI